MPAGARIANPQYLVETDWLAAHLAAPELRVFDCTTFLDLDPVKTFVVRSGRPEWEQGHIPGAGHLDLQELSDAASPLRFTMPSAEQFAATMSRHGVADGTRVVLYSAGSVIWAARIWWMLRAFGFDNAAILNGGIDKWKAEGRPLSTEAPRAAPARFVARPRPEMVATKSQVAAAIADPRVRIVNALTAKQHTGEGGANYGRPGRIAGSVNVPAHRLVNGESKVFLPAGELAAMFAETGADKAEKVITYCGAGIAASADAFVLALLGHDNIALYDGSLMEWVKDPAAPMETGPEKPR